MTPDKASRTSLIGILTACGISILGSRMTFVAIPWLVLVTTGSPTKMGLVAGAEMLPYVVASSIGGPLVDRIGIRRTAILSDLLSAVVMVAIVALHSHSFVWLLVLVTIAGGLRGLGDTSRKVLIPPLATAAGFSMARVTAAYDGISRLSMMLGAAVAGLLIAWVGAPAAILIDAATFAIAAAVVAAIMPSARRSSAAAKPKKQREPYLQALRAGFAHVWQDKIAVGILGMLFAINIFNQASGVVFLPIWAAEILESPAAIGFVLGIFGLGAVLGNVAFTILVTKVPRYAVFTLGFLLGGPPRFLVLAISDNLYVVLAVMFLSGVALASVNPTIGVMMVERTPPELHARVFGLNTAVAWAGIPLGGLLGAFAVQGLGLTSALMLTSLLYLVIAVIPVVGYRSWRDIGKPRQLVERESPGETEDSPGEAVVAPTRS